MANKQPKTVTKLPDGSTVVSTNAAQGLRQIRCTACRGMAAPTRAASGAVRYRCGSCGAEYTTRAL
jgi:DNA-directed RNA polymerase subunit RPC12/RpoP